MVPYIHHPLDLSNIIASNYVQLYNGCKTCIEKPRIYSISQQHLTIQFTRWTTILFIMNMHEDL